MRVKVPARRADVRFGKAGDTAVLIDPVLDMTYAIDDVVAFVWVHLREQSDLKALMAVMEESPGDLYRALMFLSERGLLQGARASHNEGVSRETPSLEKAIDFKSIPLVFAPGLRHECQACGSCCSATDVGPVRPAIAENIRQQSWSHVSALSDGLDPFREISSSNTSNDSVLLLKMQNDRCVFLSHEGLCEVHATLGAQYKPTPCRQFPYVFTELNGALNVSLQMECRAYWAAKTASEPTHTKEEELRDLLSSGAPIHRLPRPLRLDIGTLWNDVDYLEFEANIVHELRTACVPGAPLATPFQVIAKVFQTSISSFQSSLASADTYLSSAYWPVDVQAFRSRPSGKTYFENLQSVMASIEVFCNEAEVVARERNLPYLANRFVVLARSTREAAQINLNAKWDDPDAARTILTDLFISGITGRDILRHCRDLRTGLGWLVLRSWLVLALASARAIDACRVSLRITDLIDSMVTVCKMARERAVLEVVDGLRSDIVSVFLTHLEALTSHAALPKWGPEE
jgi:Fe-S-cluster containining protein